MSKQKNIHIITYHEKIALIVIISIVALSLVALALFEFDFGLWPGPGNETQTNASLEAGETTTTVQLGEDVSTTITTTSTGGGGGDGSSTVATTVTTTTILDPDGDEDGDGFTNQIEIEAGTDPFDPYDKPICESTTTSITTSLSTTSSSTTSTVRTTTTVVSGPNACCERTKTGQRVCYAGSTCPIFYTKIAQYATGKECTNNCGVATTSTTSTTSTSVTTTTVRLCDDGDSNSGSLSAQSFVPEWCWDDVMGSQNDRCANSNNAIEWTCVNNRCVENTVSCNYGCKTNQCGLGYCSVTSSTTTSISTTTTSTTSTSTTSTSTTTTTTIADCQAFADEHISYYHGESHPEYTEVGQCWVPANNKCVGESLGGIWSYNKIDHCCVWSCMDDDCIEMAPEQGYELGHHETDMTAGECHIYAMDQCWWQGGWEADERVEYCCLYTCTGYD